MVVQAPGLLGDALVPLFLRGFSRLPSWKSRPEGSVATNYAGVRSWENYVALGNRPVSIVPPPAIIAVANESRLLVIGAGVAGMRAAIELADRRPGPGGGQGQPARIFLRICAGRHRRSAERRRRSGPARAGHPLAGDGLCNRLAVHTLVEEGPAAIQQLIDWGAAFDREGGSLSFTREGAHSRNRILHAHGDSTGREIARTFIEKPRRSPTFDFPELCRHRRTCCWRTGVLRAPACGMTDRGMRTVHARAVLLATGGLGQRLLETTNPDVATGDGVAMA